MPSGRAPVGRQVRTSYAAMALAVAAFACPASSHPADTGPAQHATARARSPALPTRAAAQVAPANRIAPAAVQPARPAPVVRLHARIVARHPHDAAAFTQGLIWHDGHLYESTGKEGRSEVRKVRLNDGRVVARAAIPTDQFGEGLALVGRDLISLTWTSGIAHRWDARTLRPRGTMRYAGEGWGLASDGRMLVLSDGTPTLRFVDAASFGEQRRVTITANGRAVRNLNELEFVDGALFGNIWHRNHVVRINPSSGEVNGLLDLSALAAEVGAADPEAVLNGIAWDAQKRRLFVTGKLWPTVFELELIDTPAAP